MHSLSSHSYHNRRGKFIESYQFYLGLVRQRIDFWFPFSLWKVENSPSGIRGKLISCTEYRVITQKKKRASNFHLDVNLLECTTDFELGYVSTGCFFFFASTQGPSNSFSCSFNFVTVDFDN